MSEQTHARSFGSVAAAYDRGRPGYPPAAAAWLTSDRPLTVLELGAGTGKLTEQLVALGHDVHATDPDAAMLSVLEANLPGVRTSVASAEQLPAGDRTFDVVVSAQAFHWFDLDRALPEIARVLKPGGRISLVWNQRDDRIPWVKRLGALIGTQDQLREPASALDASELYDETETETFRFWQTIDRTSIQDLVLSRSHVAVLDEAGRAAKLAEVVAFYDDYGRGMDGMQLPYVASCFRARVLDRPVTTATAVEYDAPVVTTGSHPAIVDEVLKAPRAATSVDDDTAMLLIDFR